MNRAQSMGGRERTILLVDDEPLNIRVMSQILRDSYRIMVATGGNEALKCAASPHPPDLILLDFVMPDLDGLAVCRELKGAEQTKNIPVIMVTGKASDQDIAQILEAGVEDCITKPVHPELLKKKVENALELARCRKRSVTGNEVLAAALEQEKETNAALSATIRRMEKELDASRQYRHMFLAEMHHEIKTHLTTITGMTGLALRKDLSEELLDYIITIEKATTTLVELINDIVDLSMLEENELEPEYREFSPALLINEVCDACGELAFKKKAELVLDTSPELPALLKGSPTRIRQLVTHLVHYNIKWLNGREILLKAGGRMSGNDEYLLEIAISCLDNSLTDSEAKGLLEYVDPLERSKGATSAGSGLGLPICRRIVERMSGHMDVNATTDGGITFRCVIPLACVERQPRPVNISPRLTQGLRVLVLDDSRLAAGVVAGMLERLGCRVEISNEWVDVLGRTDSAGSDKAEGCNWDIMLIDWSMPGIDGLELTRRIRAAGCSVPVIIMGMPALMMMRMVHQRKFNAEGGSDGRTGGEINTGFIMKPIKTEPLLEKIYKMISEDSGETLGHGYEADDRPPDDLRGLRILLVEDNAINRQIARQLLEMADMDVTGVSTGNSAVEAASSSQYDVILMDIELPDMNGMEAAEVIRKNTLNAHTPVIALTAHSWASHRRAYRKAGIAWCIEKPIDLDELYETIRRAVSAEEGGAAK